MDPASEAKFNVQFALTLEERTATAANGAKFQRYVAILDRSYPEGMMPAPPGVAEDVLPKRFEVRLTKSLYESLLPKCRDVAGQQTYNGARLIIELGTPFEVPNP